MSVTGPLFQPRERAPSSQSYADRKAARIKRLREGAERRRRAAAAAHASVHRKLDCMNGTPILVGHHSEKRHRRDLARIDTTLRNSFEAVKEAESMERRADAAERSDVISSDDPDAVGALRAKLATEETQLEALKLANKALRAGRDEDAYALLSWWKTPARTVEIWRSLGHKTIPTGNATASIRAIKARIAQLEAKAVSELPPDVIFEGGRITESREDNRVRILFDAKPSETLRAELKSSGFRWSPLAEAWQRQASPMAWRAARYALRSLGVAS